MDNTLQEQQMAKTLHITYKRGKKKHQQDLTRICGREKKSDFFFFYSTVPGIFEKDEREATKLHKLHDF